jgi:hypothetical protein
VAVDADASRTLAHLPKTEAGMPGRAPENFQPDLSEMTASVADKLTARMAASEAGQRNACDM